MPIKNAPDFSTAKIGDRVWGIHGGASRRDGTNGEIRDTEFLNTYPIEVEHDNGDRLTYTLNGLLYYKYDPVPSLYWSEPEIICSSR